MSIHYLVQPYDGTADSYVVVYHLFVNFMYIAQLTKIGLMSGANYLDFCGMSLGVIEGDDHAIGQIQIMAFDLQDPCRHLHIF